jgi:hypothetical protein
MADGTLRLTVDISPQDAQDAFKLFGLPDQPMAITRLTVEASKQSMQEEVIKPKGGELSRLAGIFCNDTMFYKWIKSLNPTNDYDDELGAKEWIYWVCDITSRAQLDHSVVAANKFHQLIRIPYSEWLKTNG